MTEKRSEQARGFLGSSPEQNAEWVAEHEAAVHRLHPDLKAAYQAWADDGRLGSLFGYLPKNYRELLG